MNPPVTRSAFIRSASLTSAADAAMKINNLPSANQYLTKEYRPGFGV
jgi:hypothetical protein